MVMARALLRICDDCGGWFSGKPQRYDLLGPLCSGCYQKFIREALADQRDHESLVSDWPWQYIDLAEGRT